MNKVINLFVCAVLVAFAVTTRAQDTTTPDASTATKAATATLGHSLPSFKTFYRHGNFKGDVSLEATGPLAGRLRVEGVRCFIDDEVTAVIEDGKFVIVGHWKPHEPSSAAFCGNRPVKMRIPPKGGTVYMGETGTAGVFSF